VIVIVVVFIVAGIMINPVVRQWSIEVEGRRGEGSPGASLCGNRVAFVASGAVGSIKGLYRKYKKLVL
jgi:hypothetical protein